MYQGSNSQMNSKTPQQKNALQLEFTKELWGSKRPPRSQTPATLAFRRLVRVVVPCVVLSCLWACGAGGADQGNAAVRSAAQKKPGETWALIIGGGDKVVLQELDPDRRTVVLKDTNASYLAPVYGDLNGIVYFVDLWRNAIVGTRVRDKAEVFRFALNYSPRELKFSPLALLLDAEEKNLYFTDKERTLVSLSLTDQSLRVIAQGNFECLVPCAWTNATHILCIDRQDLVEIETGTGERRQVLPGTRVDEFALSPSGTRLFVSTLTDHNKYPASELPRIRKEGLKYTTSSKVDGTLDYVETAVPGTGNAYLYEYPGMRVLSAFDPNEPLLSVGEQYSSFCISDDGIVYGSIHTDSIMGLPSQEFATLKLSPTSAKVVHTYPGLMSMGVRWCKNFPDVSSLKSGEPGASETPATAAAALTSGSRSQP